MWRPWEMMRRMEEEMDRLFQGATGRSLVPWAHTQGGPCAPWMDVFEKDYEVVGKAEIHGIDPKDLEVSATEYEVVLSGESRREEDVKEEGFYRSERAVGRFYHRIPLPTSVKADQAKATYQWCSRG